MKKCHLARGLVSAPIALPEGTRRSRTHSAGVSYLCSAAAHGITAIDAIRAAIEGEPGYRHPRQSPNAHSRNPVNGQADAPKLATPADRGLRPVVVSPWPVMGKQVLTA